MSPSFILESIRAFLSTQPLLAESVSWTYKVPEDRETQLFDLYLLLSFKQIMDNPKMMERGLTKPGWDENTLKDLEAIVDDGLKVLVDHMTEDYLKAGAVAIASELRHVFDAGNMSISTLKRTLDKGEYRNFMKYWHNLPKYKAIINDEDLIRKKDQEWIDAGITLDYSAAYKAFLESGMGLDALCELGKKLFPMDVWRSSYGGKNWAKIAKEIGVLNDTKGTSNKALVLDRVIDLVHNTGLMIDKSAAFAKNGSFAWMKKALDFKKKASAWQMAENSSFPDSVIGKLIRLTDLGGTKEEEIKGSEPHSVPKSEPRSVPNSETPSDTPTGWISEAVQELLFGADKIEFNAKGSAVSKSQEATDCYVKPNGSFARTNTHELASKLYKVQVYNIDPVIEKLHDTFMKTGVVRVQFELGKITIWMAGKLTNDQLDSIVSIAKANKGKEIFDLSVHSGPGTHGYHKMNVEETKDILSHHFLKKSQDKQSDEKDDDQQGKPKPDPETWHKHTFGGGWVENTATVSVTAYVGEHAMVYGYAKVKGRAWITDEATVYGYAVISGHAKVLKQASIYEHAQVTDNATIGMRAHIYGSATIEDYAVVSGDAHVFGNASVEGSAEVRGSALIKDDATIGGNAKVFGKATIMGAAVVEGNAAVFDDAVIIGDALIDGDAKIGQDAKVDSHVSSGTLPKPSSAESNIAPWSVLLADVKNKPVTIVDADGNYVQGDSYGALQTKLNFPDTDWTPWLLKHKYVVIDITDATIHILAYARPTSKQVYSTQTIVSMLLHDQETIEIYKGGKISPATVIGNANVLWKHDLQAKLKSSLLSLY